MRTFCPEPACENSLLYNIKTIRIFDMEAERINALAAQLEDLSERAKELRGYL